MVKNIPTIERSTKIRFGKHATDDQAENTIVFNASDTAINASTAGTMYMAPLREASLAGATFIGYSSSTKEVVDTGVETSLLGGVTLDSAGKQGNVVSNSIPHFANVTTAFTTGHGANVGISNTASSHMLSVSDKIFMSNTGAEAIKVEGNVRANRFFGGTSVTIDQGATNKIQVSGKIKTSSIETSDSIAISNNQTVTKLVSVGTHTFINTPSASENAITTSGNVSAAFYKGDGGLLSNVQLSSTLPISKGGTGATTASAAASALGLGAEDQPSFVTVNANVNASNIVSDNGSGINQLNASNVSSGTLAIARGGTGAGSAAAAASALGLGAEDQPSFVTVSANVNASNIVSADGRGINQLNASNVNTGTLAIAQGGTGASTLNNLITMGTHTTGDFVGTITGGDGIASTGATSGEDIDHSLSIDAKTNGGLVFESNKLAVDLAASSITGTLAVGDGGTGATTASAAASALGLGAEDSPSFVTMNANVIAHNVASTSLTNGIIPYVHSTKQLRDSKLSYNDATYVTSLASNLTVTGNLLVQGSTTFQHSNIHSVSDPIIEVGNANAIDTIDMGMIMTRPTANVAAGFRGDEKEYTIAFTLSDPDGAHIVPTMATSDGYITANVWGNVLSGNVTSTGLIHGGTLKGAGSAITALNMGNAGSGTLAVARGGTGATTLNDLITLGTHTTGNYVTSITGGDGITAGAAAESGTPTVAIDPKTDGGLVFESNKLAVDLAASSITGTLAVGDGGTGATTASAAASALGLGAEDSPSFVTMNANVIAHNVASTSLTNGIIPYVHSTKQLRDSKLSYNDATYVTSLASNLTVTGNLLVQGSTTFQHSNIHSVSDPIIEVGNANAIDTIDMGMIMTRPTANVAAGFRGDEKEYTIAFTLSDPDGAHIVPTMATSDGYITANVWGNVLSGNVTSTGLIHGGTLKGAGSAITALNMGNAGSGTLAVARGGTGATTLNDLITLGTHTTGNYVTSITGGDGITAGAAAESGTPTVAIDPKTDGGLVFESNKLAVDLAASSITGTLAVGDGGTGATSLTDLITLGTHTTGNYVTSITGGDGITAGGAAESGTPTVAIDAKSNGGLVIESNKLAVDLGASSITGTLAIGDGGTGQTTASAAASALGVGAEDSPSFVTVNTNVNAGNVTSASIKLTDPGIVGTFNTQTITINAKNRTYGTAPLVVINGDLESLYFTNLINGAQIIVPILATGADRSVSKDLTNVNFTVITEDVSITQNKHALMSLSNISGNIYMNTVAFS